uniref:Uncharacterized protein n=1 Tax=Arundo donax TaxID=35708 RepID=A0A0A9GDP7_ARUDO
MRSFWVSFTKCFLDAENRRGIFCSYSLLKCIHSSVETLEV